MTLTAPLYKEYTAEREKHIVFSPRLRELAARSDSQVKRIRMLKAKRIFCWINDNFPWASAREYSTIENIPEYVLDNRHGDCGQVSLLFITLCRMQWYSCAFPERVYDASSCLEPARLGGSVLSKGRGGCRSTSRSACRHFARQSR